MIMFRILCMGLTMITGFSAVAQIKQIKTVAQYNKAFKSNKPMITMYSGPWCEPCKTMKPLLSEVANRHDDINFFIVDVSKPALKILAKSLQITGLPTLICSNKGSIVSREKGGLTTTNSIENCIKKFRDDIKAALSPKQPAKKTNNQSRNKTTKTSKS